MKDKNCECDHGWKYHTKHQGGCFYLLGVIGAAVFFLSSSVGFWPDVLAVLKALVWPAFLVYDLLKYFNI